MKTLINIDIPHGIEGKIIKEEKPVTLEVTIVSIIKNSDNMKEVTFTDGKKQRVIVMASWDDDTIKFYVEERQEQLKNILNLTK